MTSSALSFDIFCRVIDNFGDIGVCWRLAKQLAATPQRHPVRLWVDDLHSFAAIEPAVDPGLEQQTVQGIALIHWTETTPDLTPHQVVIEAFACDPPARFIEQMAQRHCLWINLEYLSAENWVESCHAMPSLQPSGQQKYFFFPGFTSATGGLLRETELMAARDQWLGQPELRWRLLQHINLPQPLMQGLQQGWRQVFLFCYPGAPCAELVQALRHNPVPTVVLAPAGVCSTLQDLQTDHVHIAQIPFVDQIRFDQLLWSSDLNFVRGEDSFVRALWSGKPLIWQIYPQEQNAHLAKLQAWLAHTPFNTRIHRLMHAWNAGQESDFSLHLQNELEGQEWQDWQCGAQQFCRKLADQTDLAHSLISFCAKNQRKE